MRPIAEVNREKRVYKMTHDEFVKGEWINDLKKFKEEGFKFEVFYINDYLTISKFKIKEDDKGTLKRMKYKIKDIQEGDRNERKREYK
jgi:predicted nucleotidyltransferase